MSLEMYHPIGVLPAMPLISNISVTSTTASISWEVSYVTSYNECYYIEYKGLIYDISGQTSQKINVLLNIQNYNITLTGLEEANTYEFSIIAVNYAGNSNSSLMNFTTLEDGKMENCDNMHSNNACLVRTYFIMALLVQTEWVKAC